MRKKPLVGISTCLLGENVRYDGGGKLDRYIRDVLGRHVDFIPVCPEVESGMGVPREAMRLVNMNGSTRLMTQRTEKDLTEQMERWMHKKLKKISDPGLCGYIFKSGSPSCGLMRVKCYRKNGGVVKNETGIFARGLTEQFPLLPVEEEGRLNDSKLRENFIERIFVMQRWHEMNNSRKSANRIMDFHARHKYLLMAHCPKTLRELGRLTAGAKKSGISEIYSSYFNLFITALGKQATVRKNTNVLQHIMGYFRKYLDKDEKAELAGIIENYHDGLIPLIVPITLINHYVRKYGEPYLEKQYYLNPHPMELMLRNHV